MTNAVVELVVAVSENDVIGRANQLPWRLPSDLRHSFQCRSDRQKGQREPPHPHAVIRRCSNAPSTERRFTLAKS
jgi:hypothetical protein